MALIRDINGVFRDRAYKLLFEMADWISNPKIHEYLLHHEIDSSAQLGDYKFHTKCSHMSGCFFYHDHKLPCERSIFEVLLPTIESHQDL